MVDDGSTDGSAAIAEEFAAPRRALPARQPAERRPQQGAQHRHRRRRRASSSPSSTATTCCRRNAYELLLGALDETGSDFATRQRPPAHAPRHVAVAVPRQDVRRDAAEDARHASTAPLLADRTAWNKLWRRSFWDAHGYRFPEGRLHEDIPVDRSRRTSRRARST